MDNSSASLRPRRSAMRPPINAPNNNPSGLAATTSPSCWRVRWNSGPSAGAAMPIDCRSMPSISATRKHSDSVVNARWARALGSVAVTLMESFWHDVFQATEKNALSQLLRVEQLVDEQSIGRFNVQLLIWSFLAMFADGFDLSAMPFAAKSIVSELHPSLALWGVVLSASLWGVFFGALLMGWVGD